jgi:CheY-like chemotaxis protein
VKLLIVDDNPINQKFLFYSLKKTFEIALANNGLEAVKMVDESNFDVVLMDLMMPVMDGAEATLRIRESKFYNNKRVPIIFLTTLDFENDRIRCIESGADDYLIKPINVENLLTMIEYYIKLKQKYIL